MDRLLRNESSRTTANVGPHQQSAARFVAPAVAGYCPRASFRRHAAELSSDAADRLTRTDAVLAGRRSALAALPRSRAAARSRGPAARRRAAFARVECGG